MKVREIITESILVEAPRVSPATAQSAAGAAKSGVSWLKNLFGKSGKAAPTASQAGSVSTGASKLSRGASARLKRFKTPQSQQRLSSSALKNNIAIRGAKSMMQNLQVTGLLIKDALGAKFLYDLYVQYYDLDDQYQKFKNGDKETEIFGNSSDSEAEELYNHRLNFIVGEAMLTVTSMLYDPKKAWKILGLTSAGTAGKVAGTVGSAASSVVSGTGRAIGGAANLAGKAAGGVAGAAAGGLIQPTTGILGAIAGASVGAKLGGGLARTATAIPALIARFISGGVTGPAFLAFMQSDFGQKFLHDSVAETLIASLGAGGRIVKFYVSGPLLSGLENFAKKIMGKEEPTTGTSGAAGGKQVAAKQPAAPTVDNRTPEQKKLEDENSHYPLVITFDKTNPKIMFINYQQVTDAEGYQRVGNNFLNDVKKSAAMLKQPDPTANIPKKPGQFYNF